MMVVACSNRAEKLPIQISSCGALNSFCSNLLAHKKACSSIGPPCVMPERCQPKRPKSCNNVMKPDWLIVMLMKTYRLNQCIAVLKLAQSELYRQHLAMLA